MCSDQEGEGPQIAVVRATNRLDGTAAIYFDQAFHQGLPAVGAGAFQAAGRFSLCKK